jgi:hypothetical protein
MEPIIEGKSGIRNPMAMEHLFTKITKWFIVENGSMINHMAWENSLMKIKVFILEILSMGKSVEMVLSNGLMEVNTRDNLLMEKCMEVVNIKHPTDKYTLETL